ncbi:TPA: hypothetical protein MH397_24300 [Klebsiella pneumoniae]|nr:hypothetical protein [Klebsiella pneumoniae]HBX5215446.1 hypothetical protein [Klebsiella pneumoniae]HBX5216428.1 hypothetical protein [Klebsiella pneumoniae]
MSGWRSEKVSTIREEFDEINDSMKGSSSRMKNKVGAQKGAFIKMKQKNMYIYQRILVVCYVPIIHLNQNVTENASLKASLGLHQGCFPRRPMHLNSMLLSLSQGIKTTITVSDKSSRGLRSISIIHGS